MSCLKSPIPRVCVENPVPQSRFNLPPPSQVIQPFQFGHPFSKRTYLWLRNLPPLIPTSFFLPSDVTSTVKAKWYNNVTVSNHGYLRSKTFPGVASAIANQWYNFALGSDKSQGLP